MLIPSISRPRSAPPLNQFFDAQTMTSSRKSFKTVQQKLQANPVQFIPRRLLPVGVLLWIALVIRSTIAVVAHPEFASPELITFIAIMLAFVVGILLAWFLWLSLLLYNTLSKHRRHAFSLRLKTEWWSFTAITLLGLLGMFLPDS